MVNLFQALRLYQLVGSYVPTEEPGLDVYQFAGKILSNMIADGHNENYVDAIQCMTGVSEDELLQKPVSELNYLFIKGLFDNDIHSLLKFMRNYLNVT